MGTADFFTAFSILVVFAFPNVKYACQYVARLLLAVLDDVTVDVLSGRDLRVAEHLRDCDDIRSLEKHH